MHLIAAPTGAGKTTAAAAHVARVGLTVWLTERHEDAEKAVAAIENHGGHVARVLPLRGSTDGIPNCLHPEIIMKWQDKGYNYRQGFCPIKERCERQADPEVCPFLKSIDALEEADTVVCTKALARKPKFFSQMGNTKRRTVVIDEDPIGLLRPPIVISRADLAAYLPLIDVLVRVFQKEEDEYSTHEAARSQRAAKWCWDVISRQPAGGQPEAVAIPDSLRPSAATLSQTKRERKAGRQRIIKALHKRMRRDPDGMVRNVYRDLEYLVRYAAGRTVFASAARVLFHLKTTIPRKKRLLILDATANPELLKPILAPRPIQVVCGDQVQPAGRIIQFMDFNGPRSYLNKIPPPGKLVKIIDVIGDYHAEGRIVLISHKSCVERLRDASRHKGRIIVAWFGALRGRNDLESSKDNPIVCHIVAGSPKTTEEDRQQLALAVFGKDILPIPGLQTVRRPIVGRIPAELAEGDERERLWEVRIKGYTDLRMQAVYDHAVTAELTHAADRARVLIHPDAMVYLVTNEPCPRLWFAEQCYAFDWLDLSEGHRGDFERNYQAYADKAKHLLDQGQKIGNADVCRAMEKAPGWGKRYWQEFRRQNGDAVEGERKVRWKRGLD